MADLKLFSKALANLLGGESAGEARQVDYLTDTVKVMLTTNAYTPAQDTHEVKADVTNEISGTGYSAGGATLGTKTVTVTAADSWGTARANTTAYAVGDVVRPATPNGHLYRCIVAGTSAGSPPAFPTVTGQTVTDGTVTWAEFGRAVTVVDAADPSWGPGATFTFRVAVFYDDTPTDKPLLAFVDYGSDQTVTAGTLSLTLPALGIFHHANP